jgi:hypothetical protein
MKSIKVRMQDSKTGVKIFPVCDDAQRFQALTKGDGGELPRTAIKIIHGLGYELVVVSETLKGVLA